MLTAFLLAAEATEDKSGLIKPIPGLMIWTLISFGIAYFVLRRYAFGPIQKIIDERRQRIRESIEEADRARAEARKLLEEHRQLRANARGEAESILSEARRVADSMAQRMKEETEAERQRRLEETRKQIDADALKDLESRLVAYLQTHGSIDASGMKALTGQSRKYTIPLGEHFDARKVTLRVGEVRKLRR